MRLGSFFLFSWENADNGAHITGDGKKGGEIMVGGERSRTERDTDRQTDRQTDRAIDRDKDRELELENFNT